MMKLNRTDADENIRVLTTEEVLAVSGAAHGDGTGGGTGGGGGKGTGGGDGLGWLRNLIHLLLN